MSWSPACLACAVKAFREAAGKLQHAGFIRYRRGHITVLERSGLETRVCECYIVVKKELSRLPKHCYRRPRHAMKNQINPLSFWNHAPGPPAR